MLDDKVMYVGEAAEPNKYSENAYCWGLNKQLNDYIRKSNSARKTEAGKKNES